MRNLLLRFSLDAFYWLARLGRGCGRVLPYLLLLTVLSLLLWVAGVDVIP